MRVKLLLLLGSAVLLAGCSGGIDKGRAGQIARDYYMGAHGSGVSVTNVTQTDLGITNDRICGSAWEVLVKGTVTESSGTAYPSSMYLCVDTSSGAVTRGPAS